MATRWIKLTAKAREAIQRANVLAAEYGNPEILPLHVLAALLEDRGGIAVPLLDGMKVEAQTRQRTMGAIEQLPRRASASQDLRMSKSGGEMLDIAFRQAPATWTRLHVCRRILCHSFNASCSYLRPSPMVNIRVC